MGVKRQRPVFINQRERVTITCTQGESVEYNTVFLAPDGITPWPNLGSYSARLELREFPDDPEPLATLTSEDGKIVLADSGLIVWEVPKEVTFAIGQMGLTRYRADLFALPDDGDAIHVCGYDFRMALSYTWLEGS